MRNIVLLFALAAALRADQIVTVAGIGKPGFSATQLDNPYGLTFGPDGALYICEVGNHVVRRLDLATKQLTVVAGTGQKGYSGDGGPATQAQLNEPYDAKFDSLGNLFIADMQNNAVRRVDVHTHNIATVSKDFRQPHCLAFSIDGNLLVCDIGNNRIQQVDLELDVISTFLNRTFQGPRSIEFDPGGQMYLALRDANSVGKVNDEYVPVATVQSPKSIAYAPDDTLWVADSENHRILNVNLISGTVAALAGTGAAGDGPDGDPLQCKLARPHGVAVAPDGSIFIADSENHRIRKLTTSQVIY
jgi:DNA-binding beta-propeller fold protein YncE